MDTTLHNQVILRQGGRGPPERVVCPLSLIPEEKRNNLLP